MISILYISYIICANVYFKHAKEDLYICDKGEQRAGKTSPTPCDRASSPSLYQLMPENDGVHLVKGPTAGDKVWDIAHDANLIYWPKHGGPNQQFQIRLLDHERALLVNRGSCVTYDRAGKQYTYKPCTSAEDQIFNVLSTLDQPKPSHHDQHALLDSLQPIHHHDTEERPHHRHSHRRRHCSPSGH